MSRISKLLLLLPNPSNVTEDWLLSQLHDSVHFASTFIFFPIGTERDGRNNAKINYNAGKNRIDKGKDNFSPQLFE